MQTPSDDELLRERLVERSIGWAADRASTTDVHPGSSRVTQFAADLFAFVKDGTVANKDNDDEEKDYSK